MENDPHKIDLSQMRIDRTKKYDDRPKSGAWKWVAGIVILVGLAVGYFALREGVSPATKIRVTSVTMLTGSEAAADLVATGYVVAQRKAEVASKGTGRLEYLGFEEGDFVKEGQVIARLDNKDIQANLALAEANLQTAELDSLNAGRNYRRFKGLRQSGSITDAELEAAETAYQTAQAAVRAAAAQVRVAEVNLENTIIRAPFDGTVLTKNADVGEMVAPFASCASSKGSVVTLADMSSLEVEADVSESNINKVQVGQRTEIVFDAYPDVKYPGAVKSIVPTADRSRATVLVRVAFDSVDARVLPEMSARVNFFTQGTTAGQSSQAQVLAVSRDAITNREGSQVVFRLDGEKVVMTPLRTGRDFGGKMVEIIGGLQAGDRVVISPPGKMTTGQKVDTTQ